MSQTQQELARKIPFRCVVCSGFGTLKNGTLTCHGCQGKGWVVVDQEIDRREQDEDIQVDIQTGGSDGSQKDA